MLNIPACIPITELTDSALEWLKQSCRYQWIHWILAINFPNTEFFLKEKSVDTSNDIGGSQSNTIENSFQMYQR